MTQTSRVVLSVEEGLRLAFEKASEAEGRTASDVVLEMMAVYVDMMRHKEGMVTRRELGLAQCTAAVTLLPEALEAMKLMLISNPEMLSALCTDISQGGSA